MSQHQLQCSIQIEVDVRYQDLGRREKRINFQGPIASTPSDQAVPPRPPLVQVQQAAPQASQLAPHRPGGGIRYSCTDIQGTQLGNSRSFSPYNA